MRYDRLRYTTIETNFDPIYWDFNPHELGQTPTIPIFSYDKLR